MRCMDSRPARVLVVEDDEDIAQVLQRSLRLEGYEVKVAGDGVDALDQEPHAVFRDERRCELTQREFERLEYLMRNGRLVISRQRLLDEVWGYDPFSITNTIEVFVSNLRRRLEAGGEPRLLHTVRG